MQENFKHNTTGSLWHRWEPHIHTPGTILNDNYKGESVLENFCKKIEESTPRIRALGITDYFSIECYREILKQKNAGRFKDVEVIFPNIELRFTIGTSKDTPINGHLLVSPDDPQHIIEIERFLQKLRFNNGVEDYVCTKADLIKLGRFHKPKSENDVKALEVGTNQFKVDFTQLRQEIKQSEWAQANILLAVAAGSNDGTSGIKDASFSQTRQTIERSSHIIFSGSEKQREFWLGKGVSTIDELERDFNGRKPCIHGSDAHSLEKIGKPDLDRYCWIKGDLTFESLRQISIEPEHRVTIGPVPNNNRIASNVITSVQLINAPWAVPAELPLNSGLITIIGARGSGKTALADMIAAGGYALLSQLSQSSFIKRAEEHLHQVQVVLNWEAGGNTQADLNAVEFEDLFDTSKVQYLSQQFVDQLCSSEGMTDELLNEIERVIFLAHPIADRLGVSDFSELLELRSAAAKSEREENEDLISISSEAITREITKKNNLVALVKRRDELLNTTEIDKVTRKGLLGKGDDLRTKRFEQVNTSLDIVKRKLETAQNNQRALLALKQYVDSARQGAFPNFTKQVIEKHPGTAFNEQQWKAFNINFIGDVDGLLSLAIDSANKLVTKIKGQVIIVSETQNKVLSLIPDVAALEDQTFELLTAEVNRLKYLIGIDTENGKVYSKISEKINKQESDIVKLNVDIADSSSAQERMVTLMEKRRSAYKRVFDAILHEEQELKNLYQPLMANISAQKGTLAKLTFTVKRKANTLKWAQDGEELLDLRKAGPFKGKGALLDTVNKELRTIWESGKAEEISRALSAFRDKHQQGILDHAQAESKNQEEFSSWANQIANWLYSTDHITVSYGVLYDGIDIQQLSPGTRGIVLLLLYLAIDQEDDRPLIIDQPEENLDPKSIFDELVPLFREVKYRRQIIIVTHNANLVVNTDADQVIIASTGSHKPGKLPTMNYQSGGLENPIIRKGVCEILEGGEAAFRERAKRLRVIITGK